MTGQLVCPVCGWLTVPRKPDTSPEDQLAAHAINEGHPYAGR